MSRQDGAYYQKRAEEAAPPVPTPDQLLLAEIRDLLRR